MEISILKSTEYVSSTGIIDDTDLFINTINRTFIQGETLQSGTGIFERTGNDFLPPDWDLADEPTYVLNEVLFKDGYLQYVTGVAGIGALQPNDYVPAPPENLGFGSWGHRYAKLGTLNTSTNTWTKTTASGVVHSLRFDGTSWKYKIFKSTPYYEWTTPLYSKPPASEYRFYYIGGTDHREGNYNDTAVYSISNIGDLTVGQIVSANVSGQTGRYKVGVLREVYTDIFGQYKGYEISKELTLYTEEEYEIPVTMLTSSQLGVAEEKAYCVDTNDCTNMWLPKTIIRIGNDLYIRSDTDDVQEEETLQDPTYSIMEYIYSASWGWTYTEPTNVFAPLDGKKYTFVDTPSPVEYTVHGESTFDTVAINGLIADTVEVTFIPTDGTDPIDTIIITPNTNRDINNRLQPYPTTSIVYAPRDLIGNVHLKFLSAGSIRIGGITLGMEVDAGFTNLTFGNRFKDYSPYEKDQFGNILYVEGVKTNIYAGTVDVPVTDYDMTNRLMASIGGNTVILNGSDTLRNEQPDGANFFSATMVVGRIKGFALKTKLDNKKMSQMATYSFEIEEDV